MAKLGVATCQILELEFAHILIHDPDVSEIWVLYDEYSEELIRILEKHGRKPVYRASRIEEFANDEKNGLAILVQVLELGLHANITALTRAVTKTVEKLALLVDAVLLGYGLCGNALRNADELFNKISVPVLLPMDGEHPVDDCVGLIIGGRDNYYAEQCRCAGTMFMNAGFSKYSHRIMSGNIPQKLIPKKDKIMQRIMGSYQRSLLLPTPVLGESDLRQNCAEFNRTYNLRCESRPGTLVLLETAWQDAKRASMTPNLSGRF